MHRWMRVVIAGSAMLIASLIIQSTAFSDTSSTVSYSSGSEKVQAYLAMPTGKGPFPAIVVIHEWWGLNDWVKESAQKLADRGYVALAVDLYRGKMTANSDEAHELSRGLPGDRAIRDLTAAFAYLKTRPDVKKERIGVIGWCMGGGYALSMALTVPDLAACVVNYGSLVTEPTSIAKISCPILGNFGEADRGIPAASVREFEKACKAAGKSVDIKLYPGAGHAFINENNKEGYNANAAQDAWTRTFTFFEKTLKS